MSTSGIKIEVKIRDVEKLEEAVGKCVAAAKSHPYAAKIIIRVDETSPLCTLQKILRFVQRRMRLHL